jgi:hypothetical protein
MYVCMYVCTLASLVSELLEKIVFLIDVQELITLCLRPSNVRIRDTKTGTV